MRNRIYFILKKLREQLVVLLMFLSLSLFAQNQNNNVTLNVTDLKIIEIIDLIEEQTNYKFYFIKSWLDDTKASVQLKDAKVKDVLSLLFNKTDINYYVTSDNKIILSQNNLIKAYLHKDFFGVKEERNEEEEVVVAIDEDLGNVPERIETIRVGKEGVNTFKKNTFNLFGIVKDFSSKKPIPNVIIVANNSTNTTTNENGFYSIKLKPGINIIETRSLGIEAVKKRVIIYDSGELNLYLRESVEQLDELVIDVEKSRSVREPIIGVSQIKVEEIKNVPLVLGERDILKIATTLPGIKTAGEGASGYNVRGGKTDQNLILLDNGVIYNPSHFFGIFSAINPFTSGEAKIFKGNIPSEFGGRLSSVIDIKTKSGDKEEFKGEASIGPVTSNLTLEIPVKKGASSLLVGGRGTYSNWVLKSLDDERLKNSQASFYDFIAKYNHKLNDKNSISVSTYFSRDKFSITSDSLYSYSNRLASVSWNHKLNKKNNLDLILANSQYKFNIEFENNLDRNFDLGYKVDETQLKLKMRYLHSDRHKFNYGISTKLYRVNPGSIKPIGENSIVESLVIPKEKALEAAIFASDDLELSDKFLVSLGLRYSFFAALGLDNSIQRLYQEGEPRNSGTLVEEKEFGNNEVIKTYGGLESRISARYFLGEDFSVKAGFNSTYQYIHTLSNNTTVSPTDTWKLSDINIKPQRAQQVSLGFFKNLNDNMYELSLEGYYKKTNNILDYKVGANLLLNETIEREVLQGEGKAYGIEFLIKKNSGRLNGWLGYTYSRSFNKLDSEFAEERINNGDFFPSNFDKPHDLSLVANYKLTQRFSLSTNFLYQTGRPVTYPIGNYVLNGATRVFYSDRNKFRIPDYYRLDIGLNIEGNHKIKKLAHSFWNISVYNVLGRNNPFSVFFVTENGGIKAYQSSIFAIPVPTITYNFKF